MKNLLVYGIVITMLVLSSAALYNTVIGQEQVKKIVYVDSNDVDENQEEQNTTPENETPKQPSQKTEQEKFYGTWKKDSTTYIFNENGNFINLETGDISEWKIIDGQLVLLIEKGSYGMFYDFSFSNSDTLLTLYYTDGTQFSIFTKIS